MMNKAICHQAGGLSLGFLGVRVKIDLIYNRILRKKKAIPSRAAVSYTHLDVYKRQLWQPEFFNQYFKACYEIQ